MPTSFVPSRMLSSGSCYSPFEESPLQSRPAAAYSQSLPITYSDEGYPFPWMTSRPSSPVALSMSEQSTFSSSSDSGGEDSSSPPTSASSSPPAALCPSATSIRLEGNRAVASTSSLLRPIRSPLTTHPIPSPFSLHPVTPLGLAKTPLEVAHSRIKNAGSTPGGHPLAFVPVSEKGKSRASTGSKWEGENVDSWHLMLPKGSNGFKVTNPPPALGRRKSSLPTLPKGTLRTGGFTGMSAVSMMEPKKDEGGGITAMA